MEKVILPKEVAEAIEEVWSEIPGKKGPQDSDKLAWLTNWRTLDECFPEYEPILIDYFKENPVAYVTALKYGCEVEKTPHEKLRACYEANEWVGDLELSPAEKEHKRGRRAGITGTLNILGIEVEGINA